LGVSEMYHNLNPDPFVREVHFGLVSPLILYRLNPRTPKEETTLYIYKQGMKSVHKKYKACLSKCKYMKENQDNQSSSSEVEDVMLKGHLLSQIS